MCNVYEPLEPLIDSESLRQRLTLPQGKLIVHAGGINPERDLETVIRALALVSESLDLHVVVAGNGEPEYVESLRRLAETLGISDRLLPMGRLLPEEARALISLSKVGLLSLEREPLTELAWPSRVMGFVNLGKPLIVPELRFLRLAVGNSAYFYEPGDPKSLATSLIACISHAKETEEKLAMARKAGSRLGRDEMREKTLSSFHVEQHDARRAH